MKKASLLSEADKQKLLKKAGSKKLLSQTSNMSTPASAANPQSRSTMRHVTTKTEASSGKKTGLWLILGLMLLVTLVIVPKPALLEYQSAGLITKSVYMPGWFGKPGTIMDTNQRAVLVEDENSLYLCFEGQTNEQCAKYQLRQQQGLIAAGLFLYSSRR